MIILGVNANKRGRREEIKLRMIDVKGLLSSFGLDSF